MKHYRKLLFPLLLFTFVVLLYYHPRVQAVGVSGLPLFQLDLNRDGVIDVQDIAIITGSLNAREDSTNYNAAYDLNKDGIIDIYDLVILSRQLGKSVPPRAVITLDAGHGGFDPGAIGPTGLRESDVVLTITLKVGEILTQNNVKVVYTRTSDIVPWTSSNNLLTRTLISNNANADYFVSIHTNSFTNPSTNGVETYHFAGSTTGRNLATFVQNHLVAYTALPNRGVKTADFYVLRHTNAPAILVEHGFISNPQQEERFKDPVYLAESGQAIANGILEFLKSVNR
jgi:N-acetylmuramoyl-L-alanine amidase